MALVIGNNAYPGAPPLNPVNDARAMAATLEATGFAVMLRIDANQREMLAAVREFGDQLKGGGGVRWEHAYWYTVDLPVLIAAEMTE